MSPIKPKFQTLEEFFQYLERENSDYPWISKDLPENPTLNQRLKFEICQQIIRYKQEKNLNEEQLSEIILKDYKGHPGIETKIEKIKKVLFCWIDNFSLETLNNYANKLKITFKLDLKTEEKSLPKWDANLNDQKIIEIVSAKLNNKTFEPLPEPLSLWKEEAFFIETNYRGIKYKIIFCLPDNCIRIRNIWVILQSQN